jgi:hypothetical protein
LNGTSNAGGCSVTRDGASYHCPDTVIIESSLNIRDYLRANFPVSSTYCDESCLTCIESLRTLHLITSVVFMRNKLIQPGVGTLEYKFKVIKYNIPDFKAFTRGVNED